MTMRELAESIARWIVIVWLCYCAGQIVKTQQRHTELINSTIANTGTAMNDLANIRSEWRQVRFILGRDLDMVDSALVELSKHKTRRGGRRGK